MANGGKLNEGTGGQQHEERPTSQMTTTTGPLPPPPSSSQQSSGVRNAFGETETIVDRSSTADADQGQYPNGSRSSWAVPSVTPGATATTPSWSDDDALNLPLSAVDLLRLTDDAASIIQKRVRDRLLQKNRFVDIVDAAVEKEREEDETTVLEEDDEQEEEEEEEEEEPWDWDRIYSLMVVAVFGIGMMAQRCISCCKDKLSGEDDNDLEAGREIFDMAGNTGKKFNHTTMWAYILNVG